jgi:MFS family permease
MPTEPTAKFTAEAKSVSSAPHAPAPKNPKGVAAIIGFLFFIEFSSGILQGYYTPLFSKLIGHWEVSDASITWFVTVQTLSAGVCVPVLSKIGDIYGHRRILRIAIIAVTLGSILVAFAPSYSLVLVGRVLVGPLSVYLPLETAIVHSKFAQATARRAIGMLTASLTLGVTVGSVAGGIFGGMPNMTVVLLIPVVFLVLSVVAVFVAVPESTERATPKIDVPGFIGLAVVMLLLMGSLEIAGAPGMGFAALLLLVGTVLVLVLWVWWELRAEVPAIDVRLVTKPQIWPAYFVSFVIGMTGIGAQTLLMTFMGANPKKVGYGFGFAPGMLSVLLIVGVLPATIISFFIANLAKKIGLLGVLTAGLICCIAGSALLVFFNGSLVMVFISIIVNGLGSGMLLAALPSLIAEESPSDSTGIATGIYNSLKTLGAAIASAVFGMVLAFFVVKGTNASSITGYLIAWGIGGVGSLLALISLATIRKARTVTRPLVLPKE